MLIDFQESVVVAGGKLGEFRQPMTPHKKLMQLKNEA